jgi:hypothetical protein
MSDEQNEGGSCVTRLSFIKASAGVAAGVTAVGVPAAVALSGEDSRVVTKPSSPAPREPVMAYVRDAERGEVTVMHGTSETTYRDQGLVRRLLSAAPERSSLHGGIDVLAP